VRGVNRIAGVDVARGVAVVGMMTAHVGAYEGDLWSTEGWLGVADGRSAALFAVLAGVSIALLSGGPRPVSGMHLQRVRVRIAVRAVLLLLLGVVLASLGAPIAVILQSYGVLFAFVLPTLRLPPAALLVMSVVVALVGPWLTFVLRDLLSAAGDPPIGLLELLVADDYPAVVWLAYVLVGLAVGRSDLRSTEVRARLAVIGAVVAVAGYGGGVLLTSMAAGEPEWALRLLSTEPHADSTFEVAGNLGVALAVIAVCLVLADRWPRVLYPLASTGALALTAYSVHIIAIAVIGEDVVWEPQIGVHVAFLVITLVSTSVWRAVWGRGPFERVMHRISTAAADAVVDRGELVVAGVREAGAPVEDAPARDGRTSRPDPLPPRG
jgi:uncharacterized membrane protein YeiB